MSPSSLVAPLELKALGASGSFEGLASTYGNVDLGGDVIEPGAFKEFVTTKDGSIRILDGHSTRAPIGKGRLRDSREGLWIRGQLNLEVERAREILALMKDGVMDGLSIGFDILPGGSKLDADGRRRLTGIKLYEVSAVAFGMNPSAKITSVKELFPTAYDLEKLFRGHGFSKRAATNMATAAHAARARTIAEPDIAELTRIFEKR